MLSSVEVGTLITALGCGIGYDEFNLDKLRYHSVIIMTDADVDGAHIRTLLLTFFFRHLPKIIEQGHIFIAQPPLYKVKKGKQEQYLKDNLAKDDYLLQSALENAVLYTNTNAPGITGSALETLAKQYRQVRAIINRLGRFIPAEVLWQMIYLRPLQVEQLTNQTTVSQWLDNMLTALEEGGTASYLYDGQVEINPERDGYLPKITITTHGIAESHLLSYEFFNSAEYCAIIALNQSLQGLMEPGGYVKRGERKLKTENFVEALQWLLQEANRGIDLQRYKGLGEMNPEQLWETTMDPDARRMLKVTVEDAIAADLMFTTLMGDDVEPRRKFIETHALQVINLDI
jgi:DNA gyrase subunit B